MIKALIFDVDGTLAETEEVHRAAFNKTFLEAGLDWHWDRDTYERLLKVTGGRERMEHHARLEGLALPDSAALHRVKTAHYNAMISNSAIALRPGVERLIRQAHAAGLTLAIATTTSRPNVDSLISATLGRDTFSWFAAICCGEDVRAKKPDPEVYQLALDLIGEAPDNCLAFEDSANGLRAANAAGLRCIVTPGVYTARDDFTGAAAKFDDLSNEAASLRALLERFA